MPSAIEADLVIGTLGGTSASGRLAQMALDVLCRTHDGPPLRVQVDRPYEGGEIVRRFGRPAVGLHALQIEINRRLYLDEHALALWPPAPRAGPREPSSRARRLALLIERIRDLIRALAREAPFLAIESAPDGHI